MVPKIEPGAQTRGGNSNSVRSCFCGHPRRRRQFTSNAALAPVQTASCRRVVSCGRGIEDGETAWQTALREIREETGLTVARLYSADYNEQFYESGRNTFTVVPVFVAYVDSSQTVRLNAEHSEFRWVTIAEAQSLVTFGGQRRVYEEIQREFIDRKPSSWHEIAIAG